jgi:hypothetical protein
VFLIQAPDQVRAHWQRVTEMLRKQFPTAVPIMEAARDHVLAFLHFPQEHWRNIWSTNPLERLNRRSSNAPTWSASFPTTPRSPAWWVASCWSSRSNGGWSAAVSSPRPPWPRSWSQKSRWSSPMLILPTSRQHPSAEAHQLLPRSIHNSTITELHIQRSGFTMCEWSCLISFQAVIP